MKESSFQYFVFAINLVLIVIKLFIPDICYWVLQDSLHQALVCVCPDYFVLIFVLLPVSSLVWI